MQGSHDTQVDAEIETTTGTPPEAEDRRRAQPAAADPPAAWASPSTSTDAPDVGSTVMAEAIDLIEARRFGDATRVLESLERLRPNDPEVLGLIAVAYAHHGRHRSKVRESLRRLSEDFADASVTWRTVSDVALARFQFDPAQKAARTSVQLAPGNQRNWFSLAAAYAGNGWFDEATRCLDEAKKLNRRSFATSREQSFGQWQVGRAVNHWAMTRTYVLLAGVVGFLYFGLLGVAVAMSAPMLLREIRVRQLPDNLRQLADTAWQAEHKLRILNAVAVLSVLAAWGLVFSIRG